MILWDLPSFRQLGILQHPPDTLFQDLIFSWDGQRLVKADDRNVWVWHIGIAALIKAAKEIANRSLEAAER